MADVAVLLSVGRHPASGRPRRAERDARALELALGQREDARVHAIHAGDPSEPALRDYLGMGLDRLTVLTSGRPAAAAEVREGGAAPDIEPILVGHLRRLHPGVVLCGAAAESGEAGGMLPYRLAEALSAQLVANVVSFTLRGDTARVIQALPRGAREALRVKLPVVLTVDRAAAEPRMSAFGPARRGLIDVVQVDVPPTAGSPAAAAPDWIERPARVRPRRLRTMGQGSAGERLRAIQSVRAGAGNRLQGLGPREAARAIWQFLIDEQLLSPGPSAAPVAEAVGPTAGAPAPNARGRESAQ
jgi:electron transfer flavoprotein beta subunit